MPHVHVPNSRSVTEVLGVLAKPALYHWYAAKEREAFIQNPNVEVWKAKPKCSFKECKCEARKEMLRTAGIGTDGHALIEQYFKLGIVDDKIRNFVSAYKSLKTEVVSYEPPEPYVSFEYGYYGCWDLIDKDKDGYIVNDFKFTNAIYPETKLQLAAYANLFKEASDGMGWPQVIRGRVWNIDRDTYELRTYKGRPYRECSNLAHYFEIFKSLLPIHAFKEESSSWE